MKNFLLRLALPALLSAMPLIHAEKPSLTLTQTALYPAGFDLKLSVKSPLLSGFFLTKSKERLPVCTPEMYSWSVKINPLRQLSLLTGSITATGLPAQAKNPAFNLTSPFFTPVQIQDARILSPGATKQTGNAAIELSAYNMRFAVFTGAIHSLDDPSWFYISKVFPAFSLNDTAASVSFFGGTRRNKAAESDVSWFLPETYTPPSRTFFPGTEILVVKGGARAAVSAFLEIEQFRKPSVAVRAETSYTGKTISIAAGGYGSDTEFTNMEGTNESVLNRFFIAPALEYKPVPPLNIEARLGGIVYCDTVRREKYYEADIRTVSFGIGLFLRGNNFQAGTQVMKKENDASVSASVHVRDFPSRGIRVTLRGQQGSEKTALASEMTVKPLPWISAGIGVTRTTNDHGTKPCVAGEFSCALIFKSRHLDWDLTGKISGSNGLSPPAGSVVLKTSIQ